MATTGVAYRVLARDLRTAIFDGRYPDGTALPTDAVLARQYGVSRQTVRRAFHDLVAEGMVTRVRGRGTFAARRDGEYQFGSIEDLMGMAADTTRETLQPLHRRIDIDVAAALEIDGDAVFTFEGSCAGTTVHRSAHPRYPALHPDLTSWLMLAPMTLFYGLYSGGRTLRFRGVSLFETRAGLCHSYREYLDRGAALLAFGIDPAAVARITAARPSVAVTEPGPATLRT